MLRGPIEKLWLRLLMRRRNEFESLALRRHFSRRYGIDIGLYSYGCFDPARIPAGTSIGRYCSFALTATIFNANHGLGLLGQTPYFYLEALGVVDRETVPRTACKISDDVWVGHNATILPSVGNVGRGAAIGAGAVVTRDVPPYAVVVGAPARVVRYRFDPPTIERIEGSRWWEQPPSALRRLVREDPEFVFDPAGRG